MYAVTLSGWFYSEKFLHSLFLCLSEGWDRVLGFVARALLTGPELMQALFGTTEAEISLLPRTKASQATSEAALGRLCLLGSQRKWEITWNTEERPQNCPRPPGPTGHIWPCRTHLAPWKLLWLSVGFSNQGFNLICLFPGCWEKSSWRCVCFSVYGDKCVFAQLSALSFPSRARGWEALLGKTMIVSSVHAFMFKSNNTQVFFPLWEKEREGRMEEGFIERLVSLESHHKWILLKNECLKLAWCKLGVSRNIFSVYSSQPCDTGVISPFLQKG